MPKFSVEKETKVGADECFAKVKNFMSQKDNDIKKMDANLTCEFLDSDKTCNIKGSQFNASIYVEPMSSGSRVKISVDLPFLLMPFKAKIEEMLTENIAKILK